MRESFDAVVVGGGQAGLATSRALLRREVTHVVLERSSVGATWRSQRWQSFRLNGPASFSALPGLAFPGDPEEFGSAADFVRYLELYRKTLDLPVRTGVCVTGVARSTGGGFTVHSADGSELSAGHVVAATGGLNVARIPTMSFGLSSRIAQLHSVDYKDHSTLPPGAVLVVGGGQTGCQIAEDLREADRRVIMATSRAPRIPRRYRGRDIFEWLKLAGYFDERGSDLKDPAVRMLPQPQITAAGGQRTTSYQWLARQGVQLFGRLEDVDGTVVRFGGDLHDHVRFADEMSRRITTIVDAFIERSGIAAPDPLADPAEFSAGDLLQPTGPVEVDLLAAGVSTVIWCTGVGGSFDWLPATALDPRGEPRHTEGIGALTGTYVVGLPWLSCRGSGIIPGVGVDAERVADTIAQRLGRGGSARGAT